MEELEDLFDHDNSNFDAIFTNVGLDSLEGQEDDTLEARLAMEVQHGAVQTEAVRSLEETGLVVIMAEKKRKESTKAPNKKIMMDILRVSKRMRRNLCSSLENGSIKVFYRYSESKGCDLVEVDFALPDSERGLTDGDLQQFARQV
jgi:hypothetical protein